MQLVVIVHGAGKNGSKQMSNLLVKLFSSRFPHRAPDASCSAKPDKKMRPVNSNRRREVAGKFLENMLKVSVTCAKL